MNVPLSAKPSKSTAKRHFRFCVPDEWYRRSKSRSVSPAPGPSDSTLRRLTALQESESEEEEEEESTAKLRARNPPASADTAKAVEQRGLVTQARLSSMFSDWLRPSSPTTNGNSVVTTQENRKSVSEPKLAPMSRLIERGDSSDVSEDEGNGDLDAAFEEMMVFGTCVLGCFFSNETLSG